MKTGVILLRSGLSLLALCRLAHGFQQEDASGISEREKDVYSIYSLMLTNPQTSHGPDNNGAVPDCYVCTRSPRTRKEAMHWATRRAVQQTSKKMRTDYEQRKATPRELKPALSISKPYVLLSADEAKTFIESRVRKPGNEAPIERFKGVTWTSSPFSDVLISTNEGDFGANRHFPHFLRRSMRGLFQWKVFEKLDSGKWEERRWSTCTAIADNRVRLFPMPSDTSRHTPIPFALSKPVLLETNRLRR